MNKMWVENGFNVFYKEFLMLVSKTGNWRVYMCEKDDKL